MPMAGAEHDMPAGMRLRINDRVLDTARPADTRLLDFLRDALALTASKPGCGSGDCGACLVLVGERQDADAPARYVTMNSCLLSLAQVDGAHVITAEGLAADGPVQRALVDAGAIQCGYCTPGFAIALTAAWLAGEAPTDAVAGNLCRCTGYGGIRRACARLAEEDGGAATCNAGGRTLDDARAAGLLAPGVAAIGDLLPVAAPMTLRDALDRGALAGATEWVPRHPHAPHRRSAPVLLRRVPELARITAEQDGLCIGAAITVAELRTNPQVAAHWPALPGFLERFASPSIRHLATIGGNLANASPVADLAVLLLAMGASVLLDGRDGRRTLPLAAFFEGYHDTALRPEEMLVAVRVPQPEASTVLSFEKVARRRLDDMAIVNSALCVTRDAEQRIVAIHLAAGGVGPVPLLLTHTMAALAGRQADGDTVRAALATIDADIAPQDDLHGSAAYKRRLLRHLVLAQLADAFPALDWQACVP